jgi:hypothetical protein
VVTYPRALVLTAVVLASCGDSGQSAGFSTAGDDGPSGPLSDHSDASTSAPAAPDDGGSGPSLSFSSSDAAPSGITFDCKPGTYAGNYQVAVTTDAGGALSSLFSFNVKGTLSITVVGNVTKTASGEFAETTYSIAPGAKLIGVDATFGGQFSADLTGQLDCPSKAFTGTLSNGTYTYALLGDAGGITLDGTLSATYDGASTPALTLGQMTLTSPQLSALVAQGTWTATLQ